ncbi:hypothetical protein ABKA04_003966 [Annulohypoxylon sp. FPYF3050]
MSQSTSFTTPPRFGDLVPQIISLRPRGWECCQDEVHNTMNLQNCRSCNHERCGECVFDSVETEAAPSDSDYESESELAPLSQMSI